MSQSEITDGSKVEKTFPLAYQGVPLSNQEWLRENGIDVNTIITLYRMRQENPEIYENALRCASDRNTLKIMKALSLSRKPLTYSELRDFTATTERTVRSKVKRLETDGIVIRSRSKPVNVSFSEIGEIIVKDILTDY